MISLLKKIRGWFRFSDDSDTSHIPLDESRYDEVDRQVEQRLTAIDVRIAVKARVERTERLLQPREVPREVGYDG